MEVRQYIGARYVPEFVGLWNNTTQYNALQVVDNGSGTSYIARKTVPAGTPLTNTEYWFVYGASSGAIIDLQSRVAILEGEYTNIKPLSTNSNVMFIGDSWGVGGLADAINIGFAHYYNSSYGGSGFVATGDSPAIDKNFKKLFLDLCATLTNDQLKNINYLIVAGGINDSTPSYLPLIPAAIKDFIDEAVDKLPNSKIYICCINNTLHGTWSQYSYVNQYMSAQGYKNAVICDCTQSALITEYQNNGHLSAYTTVARAVLAAVKGAPFSPGTAQKTVQVSYSDLGITNKDITFYQNGKRIYAYFNEWYFNGTFTFSTIAQVIGTLSDTLIPYVNGTSLVITCNVKYNGDSNYTAVPATLQIVNDQIILRFYGVYNGVIKEISFPGIFEIPILW